MCAPIYVCKFFVLSYFVDEPPEPDVGELTNSLSSYQLHGHGLEHNVEHATYGNFGL